MNRSWGRGQSVQCLPSASPMGTGGLCHYVSLGGAATVKADASSSFQFPTLP